MEKLEFKHLAPYLPYGLKFYGTQSKEIWMPQPKHFASEWKFDFKTSKPILKLLSDLTEEEVSNLEGRYFSTYGIWHDADTLNDDPQYWAYCDVIWLIKNHYDVFGLIKKGLAINFNDIK